MKNRIFRNEVERMPDFIFRMMEVLFRIHYFFRPAGRYLRGFGIRPGFTVVDYGSGTGAFLMDASSLVGENGLVYAVDVHNLAIQAAEKIIQKYSLTNVKPVLSDGTSSALPDEAADLVFAIDMFHMVKNATGFLKELNRITKKDGILIIEDGHQPRALSREKISRSGYWTIISEEKRYLKCTPVK
jgi:ubiquinone/menaquinone biosynthesis C-methylase UbiE